MINAMMIGKKDNVIVAIEKIKTGDQIKYRYGNEVLEFEALNNIEIYHKIALKDIKKGEAVVKYNEHIGLAKEDIKRGEHVHIHNVENCREEL